MSRRTLRVWMGVGVATLCGAGCRDTTPVTPSPGLTAVAVLVDSLNALAAVVTVQAQRADSARVICQADRGPVAATPRRLKLVFGRRKARGDRFGSDRRDHRTLPSGHVRLLDSIASGERHGARKARPGC